MLHNAIYVTNKFTFWEYCTNCKLKSFSIYAYIKLMWDCSEKVVSDKNENKNCITSEE